MSHAGFPFCPDEPSPDPARNGPGPESRAAEARTHDTACGIFQGDATDEPDASADRLVQAAQADAARPKDSLPFVVQAGQILYLVAEERDDWVLAELRFDAETCTFAEERRIRFDWPREVFGRLLSRTIVGDVFDQEEASRIADAFTQWLASQYVTAQGARRA